MTAIAFTKQKVFRFEFKIVIFNLYLIVIYCNHECILYCNIEILHTLKAHANFSSAVPALVMSVASMNSLKSIVPLLSLSNMRNIWSTNVVEFPPGSI